MLKSGFPASRETTCFTKLTPRFQFDSFSGYAGARAADERQSATTSTFRHALAITALQRKSMGTLFDRLKTPSTPANAAATHPGSKASLRPADRSRASLSSRLSRVDISDPYQSITNCVRNNVPEGSCHDLRGAI
ncbi:MULTISPECIES: hypothetical protein [unclassified Paraburkholderia]|uniref:hypothetical protein n=1 Tax=unclassified Paraburkholderia TaxID=2615204 RepID=UPI0017E11349|nr:MULTISPECIES: hypothetical protein [unclassified Paraburkholderia]MBB5443746.1 hypothetical protein [Paraburkholderia sp. WSM4177]MBB5485127.1 hypothetical protein [Paraburkholderia sp. WSM4180]